MKIALVDVNYGVGSTGKIVHALHDGLLGRGHSVQVYFGRGGDPGLKDVNKIATNLEVYIHAFMSRVTGLVDCYSPLATLRLIKKLKEFEPDIVHLHDLHGYFLNIEMLLRFLKISNIPVLWTFHCEYMYTGRCGYALSCDKWKTQCHKCPSLKSYPRSWFFDFSQKMFNKKKKMFADFKRLNIASPSKWLLDRISISMASNFPASVVRNGINTEIFQPRSTDSIRIKLGITNQFVVLTVGSNIFTDIKGGRWILELAKHNYEKNIIFIVVGTDSCPHEFTDNVIIVGNVRDQDDLATYYSLADVLLLTSQKETFSMVCAESLASGTPIIGFDSGAPKEVAPENFGIFVPYGDINALNELLHRVISREVILEPQDKCVEFARSEYSNEMMVHSYEKKYIEILDKK